MTIDHALDYTLFGQHNTGKVHLGIDAPQGESLSISGSLFDYQKFAVMGKYTLVDSIPVVHPTNADNHFDNYSLYVKALSSDGTANYEFFFQGYHSGTAVPEPSPVLLAGTVATAFGLILRRRRWSPIC